MVSIRFNRPAVAGLVAGLVLQAAPALAQSPGSRAAGMADAFVAVADDATSVYWNPAGMATGALFSLVVDYGEGRGHGDGPPGAPGRGETDARFIGFTIPPLGIAYYRLHRAVAVPERPAGTGVPDREDERRGVRGLTTTHIGATLAQSLGDAVVVAGTFGLLRGGVSQAVVRAPDDESAIGLAEGAVHESTRFGIDAGVMVTHGAWRAGLVARNLTTPSFDGPEPDRDPVRLAREVRVGGAWGAGWPACRGWWSRRMPT
ncbi:MAG: conjugal transfer protein TraF [Vicinamibacterales bacterium]